MEYWIIYSVNKKGEITIRCFAEKDMFDNEIKRISDGKTNIVLYAFTAMPTTIESFMEQMQ